MFDQMYSYDLSRPMLGIDQTFKPNMLIAPNCPLCNSSNTKFCYYNNYSLTQPRYFCKGCRRYWTKGGSLRNVPVGGGCRKNRRSKSSVRSPGNANNNNNGRGAVSSDGNQPDIELDSMDRRASSTTTIDLAMVYSKFLNPDQSTINEAGSSLGLDQIGMIEEFEDYTFDQNGNSESLAIDPNTFDEGNDAFSMNCEVLENLAWQEQWYFGNLVSEFGMSSHHHHQDVMGGDWCASIDQSSFGEFLM